jgi:hemoglobin
VAEVDWAAHIPKLVAYWSWVLLGTKGNVAEVTRAHRDLHALGAIGPEHCDRWYRLWIRSIDAGWSGPRADQAGTHAAALMAAMARRLFGFSWSPSGAITPG